MSDFLRTARLRRGLGLRATARALDVPHGTLHSWETGRRPIPEGVLPRLVAVLNLTAGEQRRLAEAVAPNVCQLVDFLHATPIMADDATCQDLPTEAA